MSEIHFQKHKKLAIPFRPEDEEFFAEIKENQVCVYKLISKSVYKQRSLKQLRLMMGAIRVVVFNSEDKSWNTVARAKQSLKLVLNYIDPEATIITKQGDIVPKLRSFSYGDLPHMEACNLFERAFVALAKEIGTTPDELIQAAKEKRY